MKNLIKLKKVLSKSYIKALSQLVTILTESNLSIETVVLIGSPMHSKTIINSDLDVCIYIQKIDFSKKLLTKILKTLQQDQINIVEEPVFISDFHNMRIECSISLNEINFELAFLDGNIHVETTPHLVGKDNLERHIGNLFKYGIVLLDSKNSHYAQLKKSYLPYYSENLRLIRLEALEKAIENKILAFSKHDKLTKLIILNNFLSLLIQYIFVKKRIYPYHYEKWLEKQFKDLLREKNIYCLLAKLTVDSDPIELNNIFENIKN